MLSTIGRFLEQRNTASLADIAGHVDADPAAVRGMLDHWVRKGKVCQVPLACGGCTQCDPTTIETYRWLGESSSGLGESSSGLGESSSGLGESSSGLGECEPASSRSVVGRHNV